LNVILTFFSSLALLHQIVAPCPHRERDPEVTTWKRLAPPQHRPKELAKGNLRTTVMIAGLGIGGWYESADTFPGGYRGFLDPKPYEPRQVRRRLYRRSTFLKVITGKETPVEVMKRLHHEKSSDFRYKYIDTQINYKSSAKTGTPHVPLAETVGQLNRVETPKWYRMKKLSFLHPGMWHHGIRIRPQRNGKVDRVTGSIEYTDAFHAEGVNTQYPLSTTARTTQVHPPQ
jgi:hypothetical protein